MHTAIFVTECICAVNTDCIWQRLAIQEGAQCAAVAALDLPHMVMTVTVEATVKAIATEGPVGSLLRATMLRSPAL
jgi:hypothetical protein